MVAILARYAARFSVRALDLTVDCEPAVGRRHAWRSPRRCCSPSCRGCPRRTRSSGLSLASGGVRITSGTNRRLRLFAVTQIGASFVLLAGAGMLLTTLFALQRARTGFETHNVLAVNVPLVSYEREPGAGRAASTRTSIRRDLGAAGRRAGRGRHDRAVARRRHVRSGLPVFGRGLLRRSNGEEDPRARFRTVSPGFFAALGVPIIAGRDFTDADRHGAEPVVIISQSVAQRMFPNQDALNRHLMWTDPVMKFIDVSTAPRRIVGVAADLDDENVVPGPAMTVFHPFEQEIGGGRLFVHARMDPYALVPPITRIVRELSADQPVEKAATLDDIRAEVLAPDRLNALVFGVFAGVAVAIAVVGVAGVLAFSVSARTREFGIRLAIGSAPRHLLTRVLGEGATIAGAGIVAGSDRRPHAGARRRQLHHRRPHSGRAADRGGCRRTRRRRDPRVAAAGRPRVASRRHSGAARGLAEQAVERLRLRP